MNIETIYNPFETISFDNYMEKYNITDKKEFFNPTGKALDDCYSYSTMRDAVQMAKYHLLANDPFYILSDSGDTDGITSACICYDYLTHLNPNCRGTILIHENKERGLQDDKLFERIKSEPKPWLIIPDSGTNDAVRAKELSDMGINILALDHHKLVTPIDVGVLVSNQMGDSRVSPYGSGCLVAHKFLQGLDREFGLNMSGKYIDMVALSLVSDVMDMSDLQNRTYYSFGLETIDRIVNPFLKELAIKFIAGDFYTQRDIAFKIVPKLNAVCRSGNQVLKQAVFMAFLGMADPVVVADECGRQHTKQTNIVAKVVEENEPFIDYSNKLIVVANDTIPKNYAGLVASKLSNNHPIIAGSIKDGELVGSFRSPIDIDDTLLHNPLINWKKGHSLASGISLPSQNINALVDYYNALETLPQAHIDVLQSYTTKSIPKYLFYEFDDKTDVKKGLFGKGFPKPLIHIHDLTYSPNDIQVLGKNNRTVKLSKDGIEFMWFMISNENKEKLFSKSKMKIEIVGTMGVNKFRGKETPQIIVDDFEVKPFLTDISSLF